MDAFVEPKKKVLVVDDDADQVKILEHLLANEGYHVLSAYNGVSALSLVHSEKPDVVILDIMMPGMNGYEVCERIKQHEESKHTAVIFLTAKDLSKDFETALNQNADWYVLKPYDPASLLQKVKLSINRKSAVKKISIKPTPPADQSTEQ